MKVIIAGSRMVFDYKIVKQAIKDSEFIITEVVSGGARGVDSYGEMWAKENNIPIKVFHPNWKLYGKQAGPLRNVEMANYVIPDGGVIAVWDGSSKGTANMLHIAAKYKLKSYVHQIKEK
jgi:hypothetical protein